jgi:hypothetical protein
MKPNKAQMPQLIAVGALVAVLLGVVVFSLVGRKASGPPPTTQQATAPWKQAAPEAKSAITVQQPPMQIAALPQPVKKDPFAPCLVAEQFRPIQTPPPMLRPSRLAALPLSSANGLALGIKPIPSIPGSSTTNPLVDTEPEFVLTGVINGATNVAIIRTGESERHIVSEGQWINGRYRVKSIGHNGVVLMHGNRPIYLKLGGAHNAS